MNKIGTKKIKTAKIISLILKLDLKIKIGKNEIINTKKKPTRH